MTCRRPFLFLLLITSTWAAEPALEFSAILTDGARTRVAITDKTSGGTTWHKPGDSVAGYELVRYEASEEAVILRKDGQEHRLKLTIGSARNASGTVPVPVAPPAPAVPSVGPTPPPAGDATAASAPDPGTTAIRNNLRQIATAARQFQLDHGSAPTSLADLVGPDKYIKQLAVVDGENYATLNLTDPAALSVTTANGALITVSPALTATLPSGHAATAPVAASATSSTVADQSPTGTPPTDVVGPPAPVNLAGPTTPPLAPTGGTYSVQAGDTLARIAANAGVPLETLRALNPGVDPRSLRPGQTLRLRQ